MHTIIRTIALAASVVGLAIMCWIVTILLFSFV